MVDKGIVDGFTLTNMSISPDFDLEKRGWNKVETNYAYYTQKRCIIILIINFINL